MIKRMVGVSLAVLALAVPLASAGSRWDLAPAAPAGGVKCC